jgi:hypothetical protein
LTSNRRFRRPLRLFLCAALSFVSLGSSSAFGDPLTQKIAGNVAEGSIESGLVTMAKVDNQALIDAILSSPGLRHGLQSVTRTLVGTAVGQAARGVQRELSPALAHALEHDLGPATVRLIEDQVMPAIARGLISDEMQEALALTAQTVASGVVRGAELGIQNASAKNVAEGKSNPLAVFGDRVIAGYTVALLVSFALLTALIALSVSQFRNASRQRLLTEQGKVREEELLAVLEQLERDNPGLRTGQRAPAPKT